MVSRYEATGRRTDKHRNGQKNVVPKDSQTEGQKERQKERQADGKTDKQKDGHTK